MWVYLYLWSQRLQRGGGSRGFPLAEPLAEPLALVFKSIGFPGLPTCFVFAVLEDIRSANAFTGSASISVNAASD